MLYFSVQTGWSSSSGYSEDWITERWVVIMLLCISLIKTNFKELFVLHVFLSVSVNHCCCSPVNDLCEIEVFPGVCVYVCVCVWLSELIIFCTSMWKVLFYVNWRTLRSLDTVSNFSPYGSGVSLVYKLGMWRIHFFWYSTEYRIVATTCLSNMDYDKSDKTTWLKKKSCHAYFYSAVKSFCKLKWFLAYLWPLLDDLMQIYLRYAQSLRNLKLISVFSVCNLTTVQTP